MRRPSYIDALLGVVLAGCGGAETTASRGMQLAEDVPRGAEAYGSSYAVVIGVGDYDEDSIPDLPGADRDARAVAQALEARGFETRLLVGDETDQRSIRRVLADELSNTVRAEDRVLVYFAGHGVSTGRGDTELGYLLPSDGERDSPRGSGISMRELTAWFADYRAKHVLFVADACYSGLALSTRSIGLSPTRAGYVQQILARPVRFALVAGARDQEAHEWRNQGVFTSFFLEGLAGGADTNDDGLVTSTELFTFVQPRTSDLVSAQFGGRSQTPQMGRRGEGEFVFFTGEQRPDAAAAMPERLPVGPPLNFAFASNQPEDVVRDRVAPLVEHLSESLERPTQLFVLDDASAGRLDQERIDVAIVSALDYVRVHRESGYELVALVEAPWGRRYEGYIIVKASSPHVRLSDLGNTIMCYTRAESLTGYQLPRALLRRSGIDPDAYFDSVRFTNSHAMALRMVSTGVCDAAGISNAVFHDPEFGFEHFRVLASTGDVPNAVVVAARHVPRDLVTSLREALLRISTEDDALRENPDISGFVVETDDDFPALGSLVPYLDP